MPQKSGLSGLPAPGVPHGPTTFWRKVPKWVYGLGAAFCLVITLLEGYPWLSISGGERLAANNAFSEIFNVTNEGYVPIAEPHVDCECHYKFRPRGQPEFIFSPTFSIDMPPIAFLGHGARFSAPCYSITVKPPGDVEGPLSGSILDIKVSYAFWPITLGWLRRSQSFHLEAVGEQDSLHWQQF